MAVAYFHEFPGATREQALQVVDKIGTDMLPGMIYAANGTYDGGYWLFHVWESEEQAQDHYKDLWPAIIETGVTDWDTGTLTVIWESIGAQASS